MSEPKVQIKNLYKIFGRKPASMVQHVENGMSKPELLDVHGHVLGLNNINLDIPARGIQVIMGLSGSGKSTLIRHINRLIEPTAGEMIVDGEDVLQMSDTALRDFRRFKASMVFQKFALMPHHTVIENVRYGVDIQGVAEKEAAERAQRWLERVGLKGFEQHYPAQLSGGMQQRVGLARALATDAEILLMDEAFSALDPLIRTDMQNVLLDLQEELHKTIIFITHDLDEALRIGDNIAILRDGKMVQSGNPQDIVLRPADDYVTDFIQDINRARVLQVGTAMSPATKKCDGPQIPHNTIIEEALQTCVDSHSETATVTKAGKAVGSITLDQMVRAIARPEAVSADDANYR
ncbi:proline/glycine betaine ABC transporter ATP-binding protein [Amylibacter ulvae]|uniref:Quaternary amine transport ATP-binding protein n=1 Tax=Paramylibacter ulvae TaxID=1651968 RepID=A0ABQ3CRG2_9RHOB|nr:glycine betaine/L-proline ABC transporter ATP-binding protein [Amylibacter ulvae]GHA40603.1 proline/glycine betaine ABC transporter ATP-binding protein [Amylibacter ulvae]